MSQSKSAPVNTTQTNTQASETNLAATNTQGVTLVGTGNKITSDSNNTSTNVDSGNTFNYSTDEGAVANGTALGQSAIAANQGLSEALASDYENEVNTSSVNSTNLVNNVLTQGFAFLAGENETVQNIETQNQNNQSTAFANYATTLSNISTAQDTSASAQSTAFATSALKIAAVVVLGVAVIYFASKQG
jgi:hypothetical protein